IDDTLQQAKGKMGIIGSTLDDHVLREFVNATARECNVEAIAIMWAMMQVIGGFFSSDARLERGFVKNLDADYCKRVEAVKIPFIYDDGREPRGIARADIILIGVSRTSKTPLSQFLAHKRLKVANIPIVPEVDPPEELFLVDPAKCFGLKISPE